MARFTKTKRLIVAQALGMMLAGAALAAPAEDELVIETEDGPVEIVTKTAPPAFLEGTFDTIYSGWLFRDETTRDMERDDFDNPGMVFVDRGLDEWNAVQGSKGESCAGCHEGPESLAGLRAKLPRVDPETGKLMILEDYINTCVTDRMGQEKWGVTSNKMKDMLSLVSLQSRGMPVDVAIDGAAAPFWELGKEIYYTRYGQLEMSCSNCHEDNYGNMIRADHLSQGQVNAFPTYRLKDAGMVTAQQRFVGCVRDTRAETFKAGSDEFKALELYVASRGNGLSVEGVSVRH